MKTEPRVHLKLRFSSSLVFALSLLFGIESLAQQETIPWRGEPGITETVSDIMARERARGGFGPFMGYQVKPEPGSHPEKQPLPGAPEVSRWPAHTNLQAPTPGLSEIESPQTIGTSFLGIQSSESGYVPPDCMGDVGPTQLMVVANGRIKVFDKSGVLGPLDADPDVFFSSVRGNKSTSDPHIRYDRISQRWFVVMINVASTNNRVVIAVSSGPTITGSSSFTFFYFQHNAVSPAGDNGRFADYPTLGVDVSALYIGTNNFSGNSLASTTGFVVRKSDLLSGTLTVTAFRNIHNDGSSRGLFTPQGVDNDDPTATEGYFIGVDNYVFSLLQIRRISDPGGTPTISGNLSVTVPTTSSPISVPALGTSTSLDALDDRLYAAHLKKNKNAGVTTLWTAHNIQVNASGVASTSGGRDGCRWYEIGNLTTTPTLVQSGTLYDPAASTPRFFWIPSVAMSGQGHMALSASMAGTGQRAEILAAGRVSSDPLGTTQSYTLAQSSTTAYDVTVTNPQRWGDYSQTVVDPVDDMTMWTFQEYCNATNSWGVRVIKLIAPPPATPASASPPSVAPVSSVDVTVTGTSSSGSGFFDPGSGFLNRISASVLNGSGATGAVSVNSITYTDPTHVTLSLNTTGASGNFNIRITNPDGQQATSGAPILNVDINLPIQLASFTGSVVNRGQVSLQWITLSETNNYGFEVQRGATPASGFLTLANSFIPGHGTTTEPQYYSYSDVTATPSEMWYRLKQIDLDGSVHYTDGIRVDLSTGVAGNTLPFKTALHQNYPNPFNPSTRIRYSLARTALVTLRIFNTLGQEVATLVRQEQDAGEYGVEWKPDQVPSGMYIYRLQAGDYVENRRLVLLK